MGSHFFFQGIFLTQGSNPGLLNCRQVLYCLSHQGSPVILKRSLVFPILLFSSSSLHCSLKKAFFFLLAILWNSAFSWVYILFLLCLFGAILFLSICKASSDKHFAFLHFFFLGVVSVITSCTLLQTSVHCSSGTLCTESNPLNLFFTSTV